MDNIKNSLYNHLYNFMDKITNSLYKIVFYY